MKLKLYILTGVVSLLCNGCTAIAHKVTMTNVGMRSRLKSEYGITIGDRIKTTETFYRVKKDRFEGKLITVYSICAKFEVEYHIKHRNGRSWNDYFKIPRGTVIRVTGGDAFGGWNEGLFLKMAGVIESEGDSKGVKVNVSRLFNTHIDKRSRKVSFEKLP